MTDESDGSGSNGCLLVGFALLLIVLVALILPAIPGCPGAAERDLAKMVEAWGGEASIHSGLVRGVGLKGTGVRDEDMHPLNAAIGRLKSPESLRELDLSDTEIGDAGIEALRGLDARSFHMNLSGTGITDAGLATIAGGFRGLNILIIERTEVTEKGLATLTKHPTLGRVEVNGPNVTEDVIDRLNKLEEGGGVVFELSGAEE